jgi:hypothetical protein
MQLNGGVWYAKEALDYKLWAQCEKYAFGRKP